MLNLMARLMDQIGRWKSGLVTIRAQTPFARKDAHEQCNMVLYTHTGNSNGLESALRIRSCTAFYITFIYLYINHIIVSPISTYQSPPRPGGPHEPGPLFGGP